MIEIVLSMICDIVKYIMIALVVILAGCSVRSETITVQRVCRDDGKCFNVFVEEDN